MRCPGCNKFAALEFNEPEAEEPTISDDGTIEISVRISRSSECCSEEMKEATFELVHDIPKDVFDAKIAPHIGDKASDECELLVEADDPDQIEEGGGRYAKSYFGASVCVHVKCACQEAKGAEDLYETTLDDKVAASSMDEMA